MGVHVGRNYPLQVLSLIHSSAENGAGVCDEPFHTQVRAFAQCQEYCANLCRHHLAPTVSISRHTLTILA